MVGFAFVGIFVLTAIFAPLLAPYSPTEQNLLLVQNGCCPGPSADHWFGVDQLGRDELSRIIYGARYSLIIGVVAVATGCRSACSRRDRGLLRRRSSTP